MSTHCPKCSSEHSYQDGALWICPECAHEWSQSASAEKTETVADTAVRDANGNILVDGDSVIVLKELKIKGSTGSVKSGTKVRNVKLSDSVDGHNLYCRIDGVGSIHLKSEFVRKA